MTPIRAIALTALIAGGTAISAHAHHSAAPHFDQSVEFTLENVTVTDWKMVNPHSYIYFDVTNDDGSVDAWRCEGTAASVLRRRGYTAETFVPGQRISVFGSPARREDNVCLMLSFAFDDGVMIEREGQLPDDRIVGEVFVAEEVAVEDRPLVLANGQPNISGYWVAERRRPPGRDGEEGGRPSGPPPGGEGGGRPDGPPPGGQGGEGGGRPDGPPPGGQGGEGGERPSGPPPGESVSYELTEAGKAAEASYEQIYDDPSIQCRISNIFFGWGHDQNVNEIVQYDDKITMRYGFMDYLRTIHLDMDEHPSDIEPSDGGHSIGSWDGDTLVIDTVGFLPSVMHPLQGGPYSDQFHTEERIRFNPETNSLDRTYWAEDPLYIVGRIEGDDSQVISSSPYTPYGCTELSGENNLRPGAENYGERVDVNAPADTSATDTPTTGTAATATPAAEATTKSPFWLFGLFGLIAAGVIAMMLKGNTKS